MSATTCLVLSDLGLVWIGRMLVPCCAYSDAVEFILTKTSKRTTTSAYVAAVIRAIANIMFVISCVAVVCLRCQV